MKTHLTTPTLLLITTLAVIIESPIVLGIAFFGFCLNSILDQVLLSAMEETSTLQSLQIKQLQDQLAAKESNE